MSRLTNQILTRVPAALALATAVLAGGCGLIDSNIADFDLSLPEKEITVDTADWMLADAQSVPAIDCQDMMSVCNAGVSQFCGNGQLCFGSCDGANCKAEVAVNLFREFDLGEEKPELREIDGQPLVDVTIRRIAYSVSENTMNVDSTPLTIYIGPQDAMSSGHPQAEAIGTIAPVPAGMTIDDAEVELSADAESVVRSYMGDYRTPFNIIIGTLVDLEAGDLIPQGRLVAVVKVEATAGL